MYSNDEAVGQAIRESIEESNGALKREDFFVVGKAWNTFHSRENLRKHLEDTLATLGIGYFDLYLIHWPMGFKVLLISHIFIKNTLILVYILRKTLVNHFQKTNKATGYIRTCIT